VGVCVCVCVCVCLFALRSAPATGSSSSLYHPSLLASFPSHLLFACITSRLCPLVPSLHIVLLPLAWIPWSPWASCVLVACVHAPHSCLCDYCLYNSCSCDSCSLACFVLARFPLSPLPPPLPPTPAAHILLQRDETDPLKRPVFYYKKLPPDIQYATVVLCDPMVQTPRSAHHALCTHIY
jgi:hypothetical protein